MPERKTLGSFYLRGKICDLLKKGLTLKLQGNQIQP